MAERFLADFAARDWDAMPSLLADDFSTDDRRRVVNAGLRRGRKPNRGNAGIRRARGRGASQRQSSRPAGSTSSSVIPIIERRPATRGFHNEVLRIVEINADDRIAAVLAFDLDDFDAAFAELDARYLAGEAAPYSPCGRSSWRVTPRSTGTNCPSLTPDLVNVDHRRGRTFTPGDLPVYLVASWDAHATVLALHR